jgi:ATP-dependent exoDNAse (exonuclease V) alpha subunit
MAITLTEDQQTIFDSIYEFVTKSDKSMCLLEGCAGSGKTTLTKFLLEKVMNNSMFPNIAVCAPTHKALKVIKEMCEDDIRDHITFSSLHSLLGLRHTITKDGDEIFARDSKSISKFYLYNLVIVDEASMVADQLFNEIIDQNWKGAKVLFIGDSNQINPVNHKHSIPMLEDKRAEHKIEHYKLTKIIRQAEGNPIIKTSQKVLNNTFVYQSGDKDLVSENNQGVVMISAGQAAVLGQLLTYYFCSEEFDKNANFCKVIAWRNVMVNDFNKTIRQLKYGVRAPKIVVGEKLLVDKPIKFDNDDGIRFTTNEDLEVLSLEVKDKLVNGQRFKYYDTEVKGNTLTDKIHILHESAEKQYKIMMDTLATEAKKEVENFKRVEKWRKFFSFQENFAQVKYNYAITAHNSQGSTYDHCFVYYNDIAMNRNPEERKRILYTAFTRPKNMLYIM